ncbi:phosphomannomutase/phosphoglucomutase [bacterium]|jgi:phosphomannomutase / phosphoglucomutase|nr:phosphomannomutase/phosphoglucomutase [bacterium]
MFSEKIFRTYDIRGKAMGNEIEMDAEFALHFGKACASFLLKKGSKSLVCGRDVRLTSKEFQDQFIKGALSTGINVTNIEVCPSPMLYFASSQDEFDCGVCVTASHNPYVYNGFKVVGNNAHSIFGEDLQIMKKMIQDQDFLVGEGEYNEIDISDRYFEYINSKVTIHKKIKIVVDTANAVLGPFLDQMFVNPNIEIVKLYDEVDGTFPNKAPNPQYAKDMIALSQKVIEVGADFGIGFDGDADRVGAVDENGKFYTLDFLVAIFARDFLSRNPGSKVVFDAKCSKVLENDIKDNGGIPVRYKTGHSLIEQYMYQEDIKFGGEMSGHYFFGENYFGFDDAMYAALKLCEIYSQDDKTYSEFFSGFKQMFNTPEFRYAVDSDQKPIYVANSKEFFESKGATVKDIDGSFVEFDDFSWGTFRASNTEDKISMRIESDSKETFNKIIDLYIEFFEQQGIPYVNEILSMKL